MVLVLWSPARAQLNAGANHPDLVWKVLETEHFSITYHEGLEGFARRTAQAAEDVFEPITRLYGYVPEDKVRLILRDLDDIGNGLTYYHLGTIEIWATSINIEFDFRGTKTNWLRNVLTHEFAHAISLPVARKAPMRMPAIALQLFGYQGEGRRDDILTGYPDILATYAVPTTIVPYWFAEGTAQYMASEAHHDRWDSHRDMILRMSTLNNTVLTYDEMGSGGAKTGLEFEKVYDHGYALVLFIVNTYGEDKLAELFRAMATWWRTDFGGAVQDVLGISDRELHRRWIESMQERYRVQDTQIRTNLSDGDSVRAEGYLNLYPRWSPDGEQIAFLSNAGSDYGRTSLYTLALADTTTKLVAPGARTAFDWAPDDGHLVFARRNSPNPKGSRFWDLHTVNPSDSSRAGGLGRAAAALGFPSEKVPGESRLSRDLRAVFPAYAPDGSAIVFVQNRGGSTNLAVMDARTKAVRFLTAFDDGTLVYTPRWSPDGDRIAFSIYRPDGSRDIAVIPIAGGAWTPLVSSPETDRDPAWTPDGGGLVFSSDVDGVFDLYHLDVTSGDVHRITRVLGGALQPDVHPNDGRIVFSHYGANGYEIRVTDGYGLWQPTDPDVFRPGSDLTFASPSAEGASPQGETRPYRNDFAPLTVLPRVALDAGKLKLGVEAGSDDILGKQGLFFVGMVSPNRDMDLYAAYELNRWRPTLFLEAYRVVRHVDEDVSDRDLDYRIYNRNFTLNGVELGAKYRMRRGGLFDARLIYSRYGWVIDQARFNGLSRFTVGATYLNGFDLALSYRLKSIGLARDMEINPRSGREFTLKYTRSFNFFLRDFKQNSSVLIELYDHHFYNQLALEWNEYVPVGPGRSALGLRLYGGLIDKGVDDFFDFHLGGLPHMKGYTFYSLEGSRALMLRGAYRFPIWSRIHKQTGPIYSDQLFGSVYAGIGRAWDGNEMDTVLGRGWKRDVGAQIRYDATSFYLFPTRLSFDLAYGLDAEPLLERGEPRRRSGLKAYFTLLFGYLQSVGL